MKDWRNLLSECLAFLRFLSCSPKVHVLIVKEELPAGVPTRWEQPHWHRLNFSFMCLGIRVYFKTLSILHSDVLRGFVRETCLCTFIPSFYANNQINQKRNWPWNPVSVFLLHVWTLMWMSTVVIYFKEALFQNYFKLVQTEKTLSFPLRLKTRMSCYTGAIQTLLIKPCR